MSSETTSPVCAPRQGKRTQLADTIDWISRHHSQLMSKQRHTGYRLVLSGIGHEARELASELYLLDDGRLYLVSHRVGARGISGIAFSSLDELRQKALTHVAAAGYIARLEDLIGDLATLIS